MSEPSPKDQQVAADLRSPDPAIRERVLRENRGFLARLTSSIDIKSGLVIPLLAVLTALVVGAGIVMLAGVSLGETLAAYQALLVGSVGSVKAISETLTAATPLILAGLSVALAFRAGLFNIGGEGQMLIGGMFGVFVGFSLTGLPLVVHLPLAVIAGFLGGGYLGLHPRIPEGPNRCPRGDRHDHAELHRTPARRLLPEDRTVPARGPQ